MNSFNTNAPHLQNRTHFNSQVSSAHSSRTPNVLAASSDGVFGHRLMHKTHSTAQSQTTQFLSFPSQHPLNDPKPTDEANLDDDSIETITIWTLANWFAAMSDPNESDKPNPFHIVDCRYAFEFNGGHINGAINISEYPKVLQFFDSLKKLEGPKPTIIFTCEFTTHRAPDLCRAFRNYDHQQNEYPLLTLPKVMLLEGGYNSFFETFHKDLPSLFDRDPPGYVAMLDPRFTAEYAQATKQRKEEKRSFHGLRLSQTSNDDSFLKTSTDINSRLTVDSLSNRTNQLRITVPDSSSLMRQSTALDSPEGGSDSEAGSTPSSPLKMNVNRRRPRTHGGIDRKAREQKQDIVPFPHQFPNDDDDDDGY
ncbi:putative M-phase inducer phosphatase 3 [Blattamonas nauphoetae]|uniref:protein-tyrosine-phosphatase n=1 Tax=Blattamonas nauphoetae TaxID=2049346 RepID=A0ABQ9YBZ6_9EUKA|nr:putative M-phase inducer phosphatase 3 [Blattamonas nauphoetae]